MLALAPGAHAAPRQVAVLIDTSGSMRGSDPERYTVQLTKILSDLLGDEDELLAVRLPDSGTCADGPAPGLTVRLESGRRRAFKREVDRLVSYGGGNEFAAPLRTVVPFLARDPAKERMLLMLADAGGLAACDAPLTRELLALRDGGAWLASVNLGPDPTPFNAGKGFALSRNARDSLAVVQAVGEIYQRFLGVKRVATGALAPTISLEIAPYVTEAFVVVAADGVIDRVASVGGNPSAKSVDLDFRGGGSTSGIQGRLRSYRIARLEHPRPGRWSFRLPGLTAGGGWMLVQESSLGLRLVSPRAGVVGDSTRLELELFDAVTGERVASSLLGDVELDVSVEGRQLQVRDDGLEGDRSAGDGVFTGRVVFESVGSTALEARLETDFLDRAFSLDIDRVAGRWRLDVKTPPRAEVGRPLELRVDVESSPPAARLEAPAAIVASLAGDTVELLPSAERGSYRATWTPRELGVTEVEYRTRGGSIRSQATASLEVMGRIELGEPAPIRLGDVVGGGSAPGTLDLGDTSVVRHFRVGVTTDLSARGATLEVRTPDGWVPLGGDPVELELVEGGVPSWPLQLRADDCPAGVSRERRHSIRVEAASASGRTATRVIPLSVAVHPDPWLHCWWPELVLGLSLLLGAIIVHGYWTPSRFPRGSGLQLSPEPDLSEGFFHEIRAQRGTRSGFYRDARVYVRPDYRLSGAQRGSLARVRAAGRRRLAIQPVGGAALYRQRADGEWEHLPDEERPARFGAVFRDEPGRIYFELRSR